MTEENKEVKKEANAGDESTAKIEAMEKELKIARGEAQARKEELRVMNEKNRLAEESRLKEQNEFKSLYEKNKPKAELWEQYEPELNKMLDSEIAGIPEDKRDLIPSFDNPVKKMSWLQQAKAKGLFSPPESGKSAPPASVQSKTNTNKTSADYLSWGPNDPRLTSLSNQQYAEWKATNRKIPSGISGWGG